MAEKRLKAWKCGALGTIRETEHGTYLCFRALGHGKRQRKVVKTIAEARTWLAAGVTADNLTIADALRAKAELPPGVTLYDAALAWLQLHPGEASPALEDAVQDYLEAVRGSLRPTTLTGYRQILSSLCATLGGKPVGALLPRDLEAWLDGLSPSSRNVRIRSLGPFFRWCSERSWISSNPLQGIRKAKEEEPAREILTIEEAEELLRTAARLAPSEVPFYVLGLFGGLRPAEARRFRPENIRNGYLVLDGSVTKTADSRTVLVRPNLAAWLERFPIPDAYSERRIREVRRSAPKFSQDILRHSFASYAYEESKDATAVAAEMGHHGTAVFFRHYRALAPVGSGEKYFSIVP